MLARPPPRRYRPIQVGPAPARSFAAIVNSPWLYRASAFCRPYRLRYAVSPNLPSVMSSLANAKVTVPLPAVAVEVKRPRRQRAPSGIQGDGTELDAADDLNVDPTLERKFQVQATGVHEGGTVEWLDGRGKGRATPVGGGTWVTNVNVGPSATAPANGTIDLGKFREPDVRKKRESGEKTVHCAASAACGRGFCAAAAGICEEESTWTATAQVAEPDLEYEWDQVAQRFVAFLYSHWHLVPRD